MQAAPAGAGQTVNFGVPTWRAAATVARTETAGLATLVVHTQIAKPALWPAVTPAEAESGWTRTHSCAVFGLGDVLGVGVGVGVGDELDGVGLGVVVGEDDDGLGLDDALPDGDVDAGLELPGSGDGLPLAAFFDGDGLAEGEVLADLTGDADALARADLLGDADADLVGDADALARLVARCFFGRRCCDCPRTAAVSTPFFGIDPHAALAAVVCAAALVARASLPVLIMKSRNPQMAPSAAVLIIRALTCATSVR